jgi:hypothetical protein
LISSRIRTLPSALPSSRSSMAPSQPEDTFGHNWTQLDSAERPSPRLVPVVLRCARGSAAGSPHVVTCGYMWLYVVTCGYSAAGSPATHATTVLGHGVPQEGHSGRCAWCGGTAEAEGGCVGLRRAQQQGPWL